MRGENVAAPPGECPRCGLVYAKWHAPPAAVPAEPDAAHRAENFAASDAARAPSPAFPPPAPFASRGSRSRPAAYDDSAYEDDGDRLGLGALVLDRLFGVPERVAWATLVGHAVVLAALGLLTVRFLRVSIESQEAMASFLHGVDLVFHEAGHLVFSPFGRFMQILGGSLLQCLIPLVVTGAFLAKRGNAFGAAVGAWWLGQNLIDLAPYIDDAREQKLMLLGGFTGKEMPGIHDWGNILNYLEIIRYDHAIARGADLAGDGLMLAACAWAAFLLYREYRRYDPSDYAAP